MESRIGLLFSLFTLLSLGLNDGTDASPQAEEYVDVKWQSNGEPHVVRVPLGDSSQQLSMILGLDPWQRAAILRSRQRTSGQRWPLVASYDDPQYDLGQQGEELEEQRALPNPSANRLVDVIAPAASKRPRNALGPRLHRGVEMMRMG